MSTHFFPFLHPLGPPCSYFHEVSRLLLLFLDMVRPPHVWGELDKVVSERFSPKGHPEIEVELFDTYFYRQAGGRGDWDQLKWKNYSSAHVVIYCASYTAWLWGMENPLSKAFLPEIRAALPWANVIIAQT